MNKVLTFFKESGYQPFSKDIHVFGWQKEYNHHLISSVTPYLFEELQIHENLVESNKYNRPGNILPKYYITVHDTGDADVAHTAKFWSDTVNRGYWEQGKYEASFQYVVGNDGIYHQIPDNEVAYHAGDGTKFQYRLIDTLVSGTSPRPSITISDDGYYEIDGVKSNVLAPRAYKEKDGIVIMDRLPKTTDINSQGILCKNINGKYYLGETYFNQTYELIANRGGNNNSIGIESCINENSDIYLTWQLTAKLVANLLVNNNLNFNDIVQHHYFSGKNCPQTMQENKMWNHFIELVKFEYQMLMFKKEGYKIKLIPISSNILPNGRIVEEGTIKFKIEVEFNSLIESETFEYNL